MTNIQELESTISALKDNLAEKETLFLEILEKGRLERRLLEIEIAELRSKLAICLELSKEDIEI